MRTCLFHASSPFVLRGCVYSAYWQRAFITVQSGIFIFAVIGAVIHISMLVFLRSQINPHALIRQGMNYSALRPD